MSFSLKNTGSTDSQWLKNWKYVTLLKVHIFWEGHKILRNLHRRFVLCSASQIYGGGFAKFCGNLRIYELYKGKHRMTGKEESNFALCWELYIGKSFFYWTTFKKKLKRKEFALDNHDYRLIFFQDVAAIIYQTGLFFAFLSKTRANWSLTRKNEAVKPRPLLIATKKLTKKNFLCVPLCVWWALQ